MSGYFHSWFQDAVSALAYSLTQPQAIESAPGLEPPYNDIARFVLQQHQRMPDYLQAAMGAATLGFDLAGLIGGGRRFHRQEAGGRSGKIRAWKNSRFGFQRDLIRYYESLAMLALYSRECEPPAAASSGCENGVPHAQVLTKPDNELRCQIAVVGSGPGGAITACLLAEAGRDVLLIEEGPFLPLESCEPFSIEEMQQKYRNGGQTLALGRNKVPYVEGCCVGGGSEINSGLYHRTPPEILETWRKEFLVDNLNEEDLQPHFEACERELSVSLSTDSAPEAGQRLAAGAERLGWKCLEVPRWVRHSENAQNRLAGRQSMTATFIPRLLKANGRLLPRTRVHRIQQDGSGWIMHARRAGKGVLRLKAEAAFVCGGAIQTPALLRRSGITRNIGDSLRLHPTLKVVAKFNEPVNGPDTGVPVQQVKEFAPRLSFGCSVSTPAYLALGLLDHPGDSKQVQEKWRQMACYYAMITGQGRGRVRLMPGFKDPLVRYDLAEGDRRDLAEGLRRLSELLFEAGAAVVYPAMPARAALCSPDDLKRLPETLPDGMANLMTIHLFSSCPMGEDSQKCGANSFGRVHGFKNLFIADASLLCTPPGVNPQGSVMALARRNALYFLDQ